MKTAFVTVALLVVLLLVPLNAPLPVLAAAAGTFPRAEGWTREGEIETFGPDNLWQHINGAAEQYLAYGFQHLQIGNLSARDKFCTVSIYDMGNRLNAFGIYAIEKPAGAEASDIGAEASILPPYQALMYKGVHYVKVEAVGSDLTEEAARLMLMEIAATLPGDEQAPGEFDLLPAAGRVPGSEGYTRESYRGLNDLRNCIHAEYLLEDGLPHQVFLMFPQADQDVAALPARFSKKWTCQTAGGRSVLTREIPYEGPIAVTLIASGLLGVSGMADEADLLRAIARYARQYNQE